MQFLLRAYDGKDAQAMDRRMSARPAHLEYVKAFKEKGHLLIGGPLLNEAGEMCGSVMVLDFPSEVELNAWKEKEPYVTEGVWQEIHIEPMRVGDNFLKK